MTDLVVISYFPGAGGNRLAGYLTGLDWQLNLRTHFHNAPGKDQLFDHYRDGDVYLDQDSQPSDSLVPYAFTHCLNTATIKRCYPGRKIIKIHSDFLPSIGRQWHVYARDNLNKTAVRAGGIAISRAIGKFINWHLDYYRHTGIDWDADETYNLQSDHEFCTVMRDTVARYQDPEFLKFVQVQQRLKPESLLL